MQFRKILTLIICALAIVLSSNEAMARKRSRSKAKTTKITTKKKSSRKTKSKSRVRKKSTRGRRATRSYRLTAEQIREQRMLDSLRLYSGDNSVLKSQTLRPAIASEPPLQRFLQGDTTLSKASVESLYLGYKYEDIDRTELQHLEQQADKLIADHNFPDALGIVSRGLWKYPLSIPLVKRACDLTHHLNQVDMDKYLWQLTQLFSAVEQTGDGKGFSSAYRVRNINDAILFETHWLDTEKEHILERREQTSASKKYYILTLKLVDDKTKAETKVEHYYLIEQ